MTTPQLRQYKQQTSRLLAVILSPFVWLHALTVKPVVNFWLYTVLGAVEESISSLIREGLALTQRSVNGFSAWVLTVFNHDYKQQLRGRWQEVADKHSWWRDEPQKKSTLNAVLARSYAGDEGHLAADAASQVAVQLRGSKDGSRKQQPRLPADKGASAPHNFDASASTTTYEAALGASAAAVAADHAAPIQLRKQQKQQQQSEIEAASDQEPERAGQSSEQEDSDAASAHSTSDDDSSSQWWPTATPAWLSEVSDQAQEAAAAAQERAAAAAAQASAAVQQAASSVSTAVEEAASAAAALARNMRTNMSTVFEPQAGWGASEAIRRTGLLEDVSLFSQLLVNRIFDAIRWLIGSLTLVSTGTTPRAQQTANTATGSWFARPPAAATPTSRSSSHASSTAAAVGAGVAVAGVAAAKTARGVTAAAVAGGGGSAAAGGLWAAVKRVLWPWGVAASAGAVTAGAAAAAAKDLWDESHKHDLGGTATAAAGSAAPARVYRRSATSVDLVRTVNPWQSESEADESDADLTTESEQADNDQLSASITRHLSSTQLPGSSSLRSSVSGTDRSRAAADSLGVGAKVAFAAPEGHSQLAQQPAGALDRHSAAATAAVSGGSSSRTATPFAAVHVQEKHHSAISRQEWQQQKRQKLRRPADSRKQHRRHKGDQQQQQLSQWSSDNSAGSSSGSKGPLYRTRSGPALSELKDVSSAGQVIRMAGYPLEVHQVATADGYLLTMERIPQPKSVDVVFMMHGVLDTSLTWVSGGVTGSQAFAAWDRGFDVWLGSSRSNPPHAAVDPKRRGSSYWLYTNNECGVLDMGVQMDHIHAIKVKELAALGISGDAARVNVGSPPPAAAAAAAAASVDDGASSSAEQWTQQQQVEAQQEEDSSQQGQQQQQPAAPAAGGHSVAVSRGVISCSAPPDLVHINSGSSTAAPGDDRLSIPGSAAGCPATLHHAVSAAEADAAAAAEAAAALSRHRAAVAAAGISSDRAVPGAAGRISNSNRSSSEGLASWWPGISSITNFTGFSISLGGLSNKPRSQRLSRRTGSLDLGVAAATAAVAAGPAAELGAGAAGVLGVTAAATLAAAAAPTGSQVQDTVLPTKLQTSSDSKQAQRSSSSGSSTGVGVSCHIEVPQTGDGVSLNLTPEGSKQREATAAAAAAAACDVDGDGTDAAVVPPLWHKLGSSSSLRHVLSAPDISALELPASSAAAAAATKSDADSHDSSGNSSSVANKTAAAIVPQPMQQQQQEGGNESDQASQQQQHALSGSSNSSSSLTGDPYNLRVVAHSLGGFLILIYCTQRAREGRPHHVKRMVLLSPAGFHTAIPSMFKPILPTWKVIMYYMAWVWRQKAFPVHLPTFVARLLAFKVAVDTSKLPAVGDLVKAFARLVLGGDRSAWDRALVMPHYTAAGMPLLSSLQVMHFCQLAMTRRCQLYDYGSVAANVAAYQQPTPPNVSDLYHTLRGVPVHLVAGLYDGVIPPTNIKCHYEAMRAAGVDVSYREFEYGHMDFTFSAKEELGYYINSLLTRQ